MSSRLVRPRWETPKPRGVYGTYGTQVAAWFERRMKMKLGAWQQHVVDNALVYDRNGDLIRRSILISTGRQNGKSVIVRSIFGWLLDEGRLLPTFRPWDTMLAAAHDEKQARILYKKVYADLGTLPEWKEAKAGRGPRDKPFKLTEHHGIKADWLEFDIVSGHADSARGNSAGILGWDEVLTQKDWDGYSALTETQSAMPNALLLATSTAGFADSVVLRTLYDQLVRISKGEEAPDRTFYGAWWQSEDPDAGLDWRQVELANPALRDGRLQKTHIKSAYGKAPKDVWRRERLNHWVDTVADAAFNPALWRKLKTDAPLQGLTGPFHLGIDVHPGWERAAVYVAGKRPDGRIGVEAWRDLRSADAPITATSIIEAVKAFPEPVRSVSYEAVIGPAAEFDRYGDQDWGVEWRSLRPNQVVAACIDTMQLVQSGRIAVSDPLLDAQIPMVALRPVGQDGAYRWSRALSKGPIDAVFAMTFAVAAAVNEETYGVVI